MCLLSICISPLEKCLFIHSSHFFLFFSFPFFNQIVYLVGCMSFYITFWISAPYPSYHCKLFLSFITLSLVLYMVTFAIQKLLGLVKSYLFTSAFISFASGDGSKKYCYDLCPRLFCHYFSQGILWYPILLLGLLEYTRDKKTVSSICGAGKTEQLCVKKKKLEHLLTSNTKISVVYLSVVYSCFFVID